MLHFANDLKQCEQAGSLFDNNSFYSKGSVHKDLIDNNSKSKNAVVLQHSFDIRNSKFRNSFIIV